MKIETRWNVGRKFCRQTADIRDGEFLRIIKQVLSKFNYKLKLIFKQVFFGFLKKFSSFKAKTTQVELFHY